jgi:hypothetical protein
MRWTALAPGAGTLSHGYRPPLNATKAKLTATEILWGQIVVVSTIFHVMILRGSAQNQVKIAGSAVPPVRHLAQERLQDPHALQRQWPGRAERPLAPALLKRARPTATRRGPRAYKDHLCSNECPHAGGSYAASPVPCADPPYPVRPPQIRWLASLATVHDNHRSASMVATPLSSTKMIVKSS